MEKIFFFIYSSYDQKFEILKFFQFIPNNVENTRQNFFSYFLFQNWIYIEITKELIIINIFSDLLGNILKTINVTILFAQDIEVLYINIINII